MRPGDVVGDRFEIVRLAGSGGMGSVWRAKDRAGSGDVGEHCRRVGDYRAAAAAFRESAAKLRAAGG